MPKLSGFDKSFMNIFTAPVGTLVPMLCDEIVAGSNINLSLALSASLPPLASDCFLRASYKVEAFFVPLRLCFGGFQHFFVGDEFDVVSNSGTGISTAQVKRLPRFYFKTETGLTAADGVLYDNVFGAGTLSDYLGMKTKFSDFVVNFSFDQSQYLNILPYVAYHKCWSDWYRSTLLQRDCFAPLAANISSSYRPGASLPYVTFVDSTFSGMVDKNFVDPSAATYYQNTLGNTGAWSLLADAVSLFDLRQRNFGFDYFTCAMPSAQTGSPSYVSPDPNFSNGFTISQLRSINSLQQWKERNMLGGDRYVDRLYSQYGCRPSDGIAQRVLCIGSAEFEVYNKGIYENSNGTTSNNNPFAGQVGAKYGSASAHSPGAVQLCHGFRAAEPGYLLVIGSLVPRVTYSMGLDPKFNRYVVDDSIVEMANPILQAVGPEPIYRRELTQNMFDTAIFGYTDRYGSFKNKFDELHGLLREGESLASFASQRYIDATALPQISDEFLQIPTDYLDNVTAVSGALSQYGVWVDSFFDYKVSMPLSKYALPTLQDPAYEHGKTITVRRGGFRF